MRVFWLSIFTSSFVFSEAKLSRFHESRQKDKEFSPKDAGLYHTEAFNTLGQIYKNKLPEDEIDIILDVSNIMSTFIPEGDHTYHPHRVTLEMFNSLQNGSLDINYPKEFDKQLKNSVESTLDIVSKLNELNVDEIVEELALIQDDLDDMEVDKKDQAHHTLALASVSIAIESTKLWHAAFNDPEHDLHTSVQNENKRRMQISTYVVPTDSIVFPSFDLSSAINGDIVGAMNGGLEVLQYNASVFFMPIDLVAKSLLYSIAGSAKGALATLQP